MHNYSITNSIIRISIISIIAILSAYFTILINPLLINIPIYIKPLSPFAIFGIAFFLFDKWGLLILCKITNIPNFNGTWKGKAKTTSSKSDEYDVELKITQTFTQILVDGTFNGSQSESFIANIDYSNKSRKKLTYSYLNKPDGTTPKSQTEHYGLITLDLTSKKNIKGNYFTNREPQQTKGTFELKKK